MTLCRTGLALADALRDLSRQRLVPFPGSPDMATPAPVPAAHPPHWHADLRIPTGRPGFCGVTQVDGDTCTWHRQMDFQPANGSRDIGRMAFDGERVTETGVEADYREVWQRLPPSRGGTAALELVAEAGEQPARPTWLLVAGDGFMYVRGRAQTLPAATDLSRLIARCAMNPAQHTGPIGGRSDRWCRNGIKWQY